MTTSKPFGVVFDESYESLYGLYKANKESSNEAFPAIYMSDIMEIKWVWMPRSQRFFPFNFCIDGITLNCVE